MPADFPLLDSLTLPADLRGLSLPELKRLAEETRRCMIHAVSKTGGHLGAGLGVVELTVALHHVFDAPRDRLVWDVGHQTYPHKILTGRKNRMETLRQEGGLSGFAKRSESEYDAFGAGHSSTSVSAALGMAAARDFKDEDHEVVAVIGDGALSAGMAYEALNNAGALGSRLIVVLNDNKMSIAPAVGAMSRYLNRMISSKPYRSFRDSVKSITRRLPDAVRDAAHVAERYARGLAGAGHEANLFEELGFFYVGPLDGHNLDDLVAVFRNIRETKDFGAPVLVHVLTEKGRGYAMPDAKNEKLHAVGAFDVATAAPAATPAGRPTYTKVFADTLAKLAQGDERIVAVTAAMPSGTGLDAFAKRFPGRFFDVGIAEQHAVTFAAGLAAEGMKPFCAIYSTFLQRAYDQIVHDAAVQKLPVRLMIDRAGLVGADGATHAGSFDAAFLGCIPDMVLMAASDEAELARMVATCLAIDDRPSAVRYPRGEGPGAAVPDVLLPLEIGKGRVAQEGERIAILSYGDLYKYAAEACALLHARYGVLPTLADARFLKPLDTALLDLLLAEHALVATLESGSIGGFGSHVLHHAARQGKAEKILPLCLPDVFLDHASPERQYELAGLTGERVAAAVAARLGE